MPELNYNAWIVKAPNEPASLNTLNFTYEDDDERSRKSLAMAQQLVGGYVESVGIGPGVSILCNEDGIAQNLPDNCGFLGTIVFVAHDLEGNWVSLSPEQIKKCNEWVRRHESARHSRSSEFEILTGENVKKVLEQRNNAVLSEWESL